MRRFVWTVRAAFGAIPATAEDLTRGTFVERHMRPDTPEHDTAIHRSVAAFIDVLPFVPLILVAGVLRASGADMASGVATAVLAPLPALIAFALHARAGQTFGKQVCGIRVVANSDGARPSLRQSLLRGGPELALGLIIGAGELATTVGDTSWSWAGWASDVACFVLPAWVVVSSAAALSDPRRRALHDRLAGTVVIREDTVAVPAAATATGHLPIAA